MILRPPRSTRTDTLFPYTTLFRSFTRFEQKRVDGRFDGVFQECAIKQIVDFPGRDPQQQLVEILRNGTVGQCRDAQVSQPESLDVARLSRSRRSAVDLLSGSRSEASRVGIECVSTCRSRWSPYHSQNNNHNTKKSDNYQIPTNAT